MLRLANLVEGQLKARWKPGISQKTVTGMMEIPLPDELGESNAKPVIYIVAKDRKIIVIQYKHSQGGMWKFTAS